MAGWEDLQTHLREAGGDAAALGALVELDRRVRPVENTVTLPYQDERGQNLRAPFERATDAVVAASVKKAGDTCELVDGLYDELNSPTPSFLHAGNQDNQDPTPPNRLLRYISIRALLEYHLLGQSSLGYSMAKLPKTGRERGETALRWIEDLLRERTGPGSFDPVPLSGGHAVWVTTAQEPPHDGRSADEVAKLLALPAYIQRRTCVSGMRTPQQQRCDDIGLVALEYPPPSDLYKPTVTEGLDLPCAFYPGEQGKPHGETLPLDADFRIHTDRSVRGAKEWIHAQWEVVIRHEDADSGACRVVWYGGFDTCGGP